MPVDGKYFLLVSKHCSLSLGVEGGKNDPGTLVLTCNRNEKDDHQVWYEDLPTGTIRCKANNLCLHMAAENNTLSVQPLQPGEEAQQWAFGNNTVHNRKNTDKVFDIRQASKEPGGQICAWNVHGGTNQQWDAVYLKPKFFYLKSELNGKVLDVEGANPAPGTKICMWDQKKGNDAANQLWYEDKQGIIRSALNDFAMDGSATEMVLQPFDVSNPKRAWILNGSFVCMLSAKDTVLDISQARKDSGAHVGTWKLHGNPNQKWKAEFI